MPESQHQTVLGFDFGTRSIGVAVGQTLTRSASELPTVRARDGIPDWQQLSALIEAWQPQLLVVGLPVNMDDSEMEMTRRARKFGNRLHGRFRLPVLFAEERLTTREAKTIAHAAGHQGNYRDQPVDSIAARLILEGWMSALPPDPLKS